MYLRSTKLSSNSTGLRRGTDKGQLLLYAAYAKHALRMVGGGALGGQAVGGRLQRVLEALNVVQRGRQRRLLRAVRAAVARHAALQRRDAHLYLQQSQ